MAFLKMSKKSAQLLLPHPTNRFLQVVSKFSPKNRYFQKQLKKSRRKVKDKVDKRCLATLIPCFSNSLDHFTSI